jgi:hypothetical protein
MKPSRRVVPARDHFVAATRLAWHLAAPLPANFFHRLLTQINASRQIAAGKLTWRARPRQYARRTL